MFWHSEWCLIHSFHSEIIFILSLEIWKVYIDAMNSHGKTWNDEVFLKLLGYFQHILCLMLKWLTTESFWEIFSKIKIGMVSMSDFNDCECNCCRAPEETKDGQVHDELDG